MLDNFDVFVVGFGQVDVLDGVGIGIGCNQGKISSLGQSSQPKRYLEGPQSGLLKLQMVAIILLLTLVISKPHSFVHDYIFQRPSSDVNNAIL